MNDDTDVTLTELLLDWRDDVNSTPYPPKLAIPALLDALDAA